MPEESICHLSDLVPELLDVVFCEINSLRDLGNFISTCGFIHRHFEERKEHIVFHVLQNELGPALTDAIFLCQFPVVEYLSQQSYVDRLHNAAAIYRRMLRDARRGGRGDLPSWATMEQLCHTFHTMEFLTKSYVILHLQNFNSHGNDFWELSRAERWRILRAFYRRQIICNAWKPIHQDSFWTGPEISAFSNTGRNNQAPLGLLAAFEPWELQQIDHIDFFVTRLCRALCQAEKEAIMSRYTQFTSRLLDESDFVPDLGPCFFHADYLAWYLQKYPSIADAAFRKLPLFVQLDTVDIDLQHGNMNLLSPYYLRCIFPAWQLRGVRLHQDPDTSSPGEESRSGDDNSNNRKIEFLRDEADLVPFGWTDALNGRYLSWFGCMLASFTHVAQQLYPNEDDISIGGTQRVIRLFFTRMWRMNGFALWDRRRVEAIKELDRFEAFQTGWIGKEDITLQSWGPLVESSENTNG